MATTQQIGGNGTLFIAEDKQLQLELLDATYDPTVPGSGVPIDMTGWTMAFAVRLRDNAPDPPIIPLKTPTLIGVYNGVRAVNTQRAVVQLTDDDMMLVQAKIYRHSWKRLDEGGETILARGSFVVEIATNYI